MRKLAFGEKKKFQKTIWNHYKLHGRKMPWRGERDPYKVLVSEIMLQQTQVSRVTHKYEEFLGAFPTLASLAKAPLGKVLTAWQGLGYNRRARFLHDFAKEVIGKYGGIIPRDYQTLLSLPGIGKGTAGSLSAFAWNLPVVFIETNIRSVYIHHFFKDGENISDKDILPLIEQTLEKKKSRAWYYSLMDYGTYLKTQVSNPNKKSRHHTKQSTFTGSNREVRGAIVRYLSKQEKGNRKQMMGVLGFSNERFKVALEGLIKEGLVIKIKNDIVLP